MVIVADSPPAPTVSWPISTGMLIEPTESESKAEIDRYVWSFTRNDISSPSPPGSVTP